jgi:hypothetical protein
MASAFTDQLLQCNICLDKLKSPRALPCFNWLIRKSTGNPVTPSFVMFVGVLHVGHRNWDLVLPFESCDILTCCCKHVSQNECRHDPKHFVCEICAHDDSANLAAKKYCTDCQKYFCNSCNMKHKMSVVLKSHSLVDVLSYEEEEILFCTTHKNEPIKFFCKPCDLEICLFCVLGDHENHMISSFEDGSNIDLLDFVKNI